MTTVAMPVTPASEPRLPRALRRLREFAKSSAARVVAPHRAALSNLAHMPLTVAAAGCLDAAGFVHSVIVGLVVTAATLVYLEHAIADEN